MNYQSFRARSFVLLTNLDTCLQCIHPIICAIIMSKVLSLRIPDELFSQLDSLTKATNRSRSYLTSKAIEEYLARNAWKTEALHEAVAEADKGVFVSNESVESWLSSWGSVDEKPVPEADIFPK